MRHFKYLIDSRMPCGNGRKRLLYQPINLRWCAIQKVAHLFEQHVPVREVLTPDYIIVEAAVADAFEVEVLKRLPGLTLREWLKRCMQFGANPRVYNPFLPHGLEAKLGLDYFGNDVKPPA